MKNSGSTVSLAGEMDTALHLGDGVFLDGWLSGFFLCWHCFSELQDDSDTVLWLEEGEPPGRRLTAFGSCPLAGVSMSSAVPRIAKASNSRFGS